MKSHYSQTDYGERTKTFWVLLPYEITLFSNVAPFTAILNAVLLPYEITLFSNSRPPSNSKRVVLLPYEITLFSNVR